MWVIARCSDTLAQVFVPGESEFLSLARCVLAVRVYSGSVGRSVVAAGARRLRAGEACGARRDFAEYGNGAGRMMAGMMAGTTAEPSARVTSAIVVLIGQRGGVDG